jgi:wyosine [tRNA(Phe)-imidazoG37] synthetase (radical SAM superfamily)
LGFILAFALLDTMGTFLFDKIIFGPVQSRRLGVSLGINLLPVNKKICTFDCIYCECGFNAENPSVKPVLPSCKEVLTHLEKKLKEMQNQHTAPNVITFAGNGEPTIHPAFSSIIDGTIALRNKYCPEARIAVLSNATRLHKPDVVNALLKIDDNILKLDSGLETTINIIDQPVGKFSYKQLIENLVAFKGNLIIQTMFIKGIYQNQTIDNTTATDIESWLSILKKINPKKVMIYTIERDTPVQGLKKIEINKLKAIAHKVEKLGIEVQVSG